MEFITMQEACILSGKSESSISKLIKRNVIESEKRGKARLINKESLFNHYNIREEKSESYRNNTEVIALKAGIAEWTSLYKEQKLLREENDVKYDNFISDKNEEIKRNLNQINKIEKKNETNEKTIKTLSILITIIVVFSIFLWLIIKGTIII